MYIFEDFSGLTARREAKVVPYGRVVDNTLFRHDFSSVELSASAWHVTVVPMCLTLWLGPGQSPPRLHVILARFLATKTEREIEN